MKSNVIFVKFHTRLQNTEFVVLVLRPIKNSDFEDEHENEDEKYQIRSPAYALTPETRHLKPPPVLTPDT
jgi:hypothetical protein